MKKSPFTGEISVLVCLCKLPNGDYGRRYVIDFPKTGEMKAGGFSVLYKRGAEGGNKSPSVNDKNVVKDAP